MRCVGQRVPTGTNRNIASASHAASPPQTTQRRAERLALHCEITHGTGSVQSVPGQRDIRLDCSPTCFARRLRTTHIGEIKSNSRTDSGVRNQRRKLIGCVQVVPGKPVIRVDLGGHVTLVEADSSTSAAARCSLVAHTLAQYRTAHIGIVGG
eukprot:2453186-Rhodomonas_salina.3